MIDVAKTFIAALTIGALAALTGCQKEGPAERAGKEVDKAVDNAGRQMEKAGERVQDAARDAKK
jgi:hypothetical protein